MSTQASTLTFTPVRARPAVKEAVHPQIHTSRKHSRVLYVFETLPQVSLVENGAKRASSTPCHLFPPLLHGFCTKFVYTSPSCFLC